MTDSEIIQRILFGEKNLYRIIVERYQSMVFRTCIGFLHNKEDADDLTQEVFIQAYQSLSRFRGESSFTTWLYRITLNASINWTRKKSGNFFHRLGLINEQKDYVLNIPDEENPEEIIIREEYCEWVRNALDSLPENQRAAIVLSKYDNLSQKEIAEILKTTEGSVEALIQRAKANLRDKLSTGKKKSGKDRRKI